MLVITKTRNLSSQLSGDAPIADGGGATGAEITHKKSERCLKNPNMVHQCAKCLSKTHGAHVCPVQDVARAPGSNNSSNNTNTGKGKGKGKKGKKGSSKGWRY